EILPSSKFEPDLYSVIVSISDVVKRKKIVESLPKNTSYATLIHPSVVMSEWVEIGAGTIITAGCILTCNIKIGEHSQLNLHTTIGHDTTLGDYFTSAPGAKISGGCVIGNQVYIATNASIKHLLNICSNTTIGMGGVVLKDIEEPGVYVGNPIRKLR
ncbi:MAG: transferase, partial [Flavobacteriales bacterium]|nr:transferase [Flavobacteriales bacterium]